MGNRGVVFLLSLTLLSGIGAARAADSVDDIIALTQKGVGEDVMIAAVEQSRSGYTLSAAEIIKLKDSKVPDKVITAMLRHKPAGQAVAVAPVAVEAPAPLPQAQAQARAAVAPAAGTGLLNIENLDDRSWSYTYEPGAHTIWISTATADGRGELAAHGGLSLRMPAGTFSIRYNGQAEGPAVTVFGDDKSLLMISRVNTAELEALYATVFERGERKASMRLVTLRENSASRKRSSDENVQQPEVRVVQREVEVPSTTVVYRDYSPSVVYTGGYPYYSGGYYPGYYGSYGYPHAYGGYYRPYCGYSSFNFGYNNFGGHNNFGVGIGFRH